MRERFQLWDFFYDFCCTAEQKLKTEINTEASETASENICVCDPTCPVKYRTLFTFVSLVQVKLKFVVVVISLGELLC